MFKLSYMTICNQSERLIYAILSSKLLMTFAPDLHQEGTDESSKQWICSAEYHLTGWQIDGLPWYIPTYIATCSQEGRTRQRLKMFQLNEQIRMIPLRA